MRLHFKLREGKKKSTIYLEFRYREIRIRKSTEISIPNSSIRYWCNKSGSIKIPNNIPHSLETIKRLDNYKQEITKGVYNLIDENKLNQQRCLSLIESVLYKNIIPKGQQEKSDKQVVINYFKWYKEHYSTNPSPNTKNKKSLAYGTIKTYNNAINYLQNYLDEKCIEREKFTFDDINRDFYYDYIKYGFKNNYQPNYIGTAISRLKTIISDAYQNDIHKNTIHLKKFFKKFNESVDSVYLSTDEIIKIKNLHIPDERTDLYRDAFLIQCYTGLRITDLFRFINTYDEEAMKFKNEKVFKFEQIKTDNSVMIQVSDELLGVLEKYNFSLPKIKNQALYNKRIKEICKIAEIHELIRVKKSNEIITIPKYNLVSSHTARRSFCTNAYLRGNPTNVIMTFSGHRKEKTFREYIKADEFDKALNFADYNLLGICKKAS